MDVDEKIFKLEEALEKIHNDIWIIEPQYTSVYRVTCRDWHCWIVDSMIEDHDPEDLAKIITGWRKEKLKDDK